MPTTQPTELPITGIILAEAKYQREDLGSEYFADILRFLSEKIRPIEQSQIQKAKEDERNRIVGILETKRFNNKCAQFPSIRTKVIAKELKQIIDLIKSNQ